jgi:hypothetical protein
MGWKDWVYGDLVSAADFQSLVQDQTVQRYASSSARSAALGSAVAEGMVSYLDDTNAVEVYNGSAWTGVSSSGSGNAIINGAFDFWQRGTSFTTGFASGAYLVDRWALYCDGSGAAFTTSQQTFTPGTAPVSGYEGKYFVRVNQTTAGTGATFNGFFQNIEDVRSFAGQTVTYSFWAKADTSRTISVNLYQQFGTGGSTQVTTAGSSHSLTTSWTRFTGTVSLPSIAGKTLGANDSRLQLAFEFTKNTIQTIDIWGVQLEAGSSATAFKRNAPSIQGELAACQRYYWRIASSTAYASLSLPGPAQNSTRAWIYVKHPTSMRTKPNEFSYTTTYARYDLYDHAGGVIQPTAITIDLNHSTTEESVLIVDVSSGLTAYRNYVLMVDSAGSGEAYIGFGAEL